MAYYGYEFYYDGTRATFFGYICTALINMGWELHDNISSTVKVYRSNGESGNEPYGYIWIDAGTSTYIEFKAYQYWDNSTHAGVWPRQPADNASNSRITSTYFTTTYPGFIGGDKNTVFIMGRFTYTGASHAITFGHIVSTPERPLINVQGTAGTAGTLTVATTSGIGKGGFFTIIGADGYSDKLSVIEVIDSSTIIVDKLATNYGTGSIIGRPASLFFIHTPFGAYSTIYPCCAPGDTGQGTSSQTITPSVLSTPGINSYQFYNEGKCILAPILAWYPAATAPGGFFGHIAHAFNGKYTTDNDALIANNDGGFSTAGTAASAGDNTLIDSSKAWSANELTNKFCVITGGSGTAAGGIKKITGNDSTSITVDSNWHIKPVSGSTYKIADIVRRGINLYLHTNICLLITVTAPPA